MPKDDIKEHLSVLPTEVLLYIFTFLPGKQLISCRQVCLRWRNIIDSLTASDAMWREHCQKDYSHVYKVARLKSRDGLLWYNIYRCLSLWPRLKFAREFRDEFASAGCVNDEIRNFEVLKAGIVGVHKRSSIVYYNIETLEPSKRSPITGDYMRYTENEDTIVILSYHLQLYVIRKYIHQPNFETNVTFDDVKSFILVDRELYYINLANEIYKCKLEDGNLTSAMLTQMNESILCIGHSDQLNILTFQRNIYCLKDNNLALDCCLDNCNNLMDQIYKYNFLERMDWRILYQWMCILRIKTPEGPLRDITVIRKYGDVVFVGCSWGVLRIYYAPYTSGEFDIYSAVPIKQYNFMERSDCPVLTMCPILQVDVMEAEHGHTVIVAMPKKIAVLDFSHNFKRKASVALLPHSNALKEKALKIEEFS